MIQAVKIEGFQSHVESVFTLDAGLNVITGPSDAGKTAIIRAIRWVAFNEPTGEAYVNQKVGEALVTIYLASGHIITKRRRKGKTSYLLQQSTEDEGSLYEKSEVPDEVKSLLKIEKQSFGDFETALNFSFQLDPPFLISETASAGAKVLGKLAGTESVDLAIKGISKDTYATRQERTNAEKDIERLSASLLAYSHIDDAQEAVDVAGMLLTQIEGRVSHIEDLKSHRLMYENIQDKIGFVNVRLSRLTHVPQLETELTAIEKAQQRKEQLLDLFEQYNKLTAQLITADEKLEKLKGTDQAVQIVEVLSRNIEQLNLFQNLQREYHKFEQNVNMNKLVLDKTKHVEALHQDLEGISQDVSRLNDLRMLQVEYANVTRRLEIAQKRSEAFQVLEQAEAILKATEEAHGTKMTLSTLYKELTTLTTLVKQREKDLQDTEDLIKQAKAEEASAWGAAGGICPLCEQPHSGGAC